MRLQPFRKHGVQNFERVRGYYMVDDRLHVCERELSVVYFIVAVEVIMTS